MEINVKVRTNFHTEQKKGAPKMWISMFLPPFPLPPIVILSDLSLAMMRC